MNKITPQSAASLALWLVKEQPAVFAALAQRAGLNVPVNQLGFWTEIISGIGSGLSTAVKSVGSFLTSSQGLSTLSSLGTTYLTAQAQKNALKLQVAQAQAGQPAAPIQTQYNPTTGQYETVYTTQNGQQVPLTADNVNQYMPAAAGAKSILQVSWLPFAVGGGVLLLVLFFTRSRGR